MSKLDERSLAYLKAMGIEVWLPRSSKSAGAAQAPAPPAGPQPFTGRRSQAEVQSDADQAGKQSHAKNQSLERGRAEMVRMDAADTVAQLDWPALAARVAGCTHCGLHQTRTRTVFGIGSTRAQWLFIGEAPGAEEDRRGEPFVGRAGRLLDNILRALKLSREAVYIANILKCRPPGNRDPRPEEAQACRPYLRRQIALIQPRVIVALGRIAAQNLLETNEPMSRLRGKDYVYEGTAVPIVVTYHPAYLLRNPADKPKLWQDLQRARQLAHQQAE